MLTEYAKRMAAEPWRRWYKTDFWARCRKRVLAEEPICKICNRSASTVVDHIKPHKGIWALFCDRSNLAGLCKHCHDTKTATEDGGGWAAYHAHMGRQPADKAPTTTCVGHDVLDAALAYIPPPTSENECGAMADQPNTEKKP